MVKPCDRCKITTTNQLTAEVSPLSEPLVTLKGYRFSKELRGVLFGQNAIAVNGRGSTVARGAEARDRLEVSGKDVGLSREAQRLASLSLTRALLSLAARHRLRRFLLDSHDDSPVEGIAIRVAFEAGRLALAMRLDS